jgi:2-phospho-L-lactate transferase/gluconeogenesis factor (CofD/UPF0052 family)
MFLTGARLFSGSFESAVWLMRSITGIPEGVEVIPAINSNFSHHISAGLQDGTVIAGQNAISHPSIGVAEVYPQQGALTRQGSKEDLALASIEEEDAVEDANLPGTLLNLRRQNITFSKEHEEDLPSRIERVWYINPYGHEIRPPVNSKVSEVLRNASGVIFSIGSLYTRFDPNTTTLSLSPSELRTDLVTASYPALSSEV